MSGFSVGIAADGSEFSKAVKSDMVAPLEDVQDTVKKLAADLDKTGDSGVKGFTEQQKATKDYQAEIKQLSNTIQDSAKVQTHASQQVTEGVELSTREQRKLTKEGLSTIGDEAKNVISGFDGNVADLASTASQSLIGVVQSFGPAGIALGTAGAIAFGLIQAASEGADEETAQFKQQVADLTTALIEAGRTGAPPISYIGDQLEKLAEQSDDGEQSLSKLFDTAKESGNDADAFALAVAGQTKSLKGLLEAGEEKLKQDQRAADVAHVNLTETQQVTGAEGERAEKLREIARSQEDYNKTLKTTVDAQDTASKKAKEYEEVNKALTGQTIKETAAQKEYSDATLKTFDDIGDQLEAKQDDINSALTAANDKYASAVAASNGKQTAAVKKARAEQVAASKAADVETVDSFIAAQDADLAALTRANVDKIKIYEIFGKDASKVINSAGDNADLLDSLAGASPAQVAKILDNYSSLGAAAGTNIKKDAQGILNGAALTVPAVKVSADTSSAEAKIRALATKQYTVQINGVSRDGKKIF